MTAEAGSLVLVTVGAVTDTPFHVVGRRMGWDAVDLPGHAWLDVNMGGPHLPQRYGESEFAELADDDVARHGLCPECRGFGFPPDLYPPTAVPVGAGIAPGACEACHGSGKTAVRVEVLRDEPGVTEVKVEIDAEAAATMSCEQCRRALEPVPVRRPGE